MRQAYVGFYWTRSVPRTGFIVLPHDVDAAARKSKTILYQRTLIRDYVEEAKGHLIREVPFMDISPDRVTKLLYAELESLIPYCKKNNAKIAYADFYAKHWRRVKDIEIFLKDHGVECDPVWPRKILIGDDKIDPIKHFKTWQECHENEPRALREQARSEVAALGGTLIGRPGGYRAAADELNARGIKTSTGRRWTAEGVRKTFKRHGCDFADRPGMVMPPEPKPLAD